MSILDDIMAGLSSTSAAEAAQVVQKGAAVVGSFLDPYSKGGMDQVLVPVTISPKPEAGSAGVKAGVYATGQPAPGMPDAGAAANRSAWLAPVALLGALGLGWYLLRD